VVASNICPGQPPIALEGPIEVAFDRLLSPASVTRQSFILRDKRGGLFTPTIAYDPVARVVTIAPAQTPFADGEFYELAIVPPHDPSDPNGLRAIDGATLDVSQPPVQCASSQTTAVLTFRPAASTPRPAPAPVVDFCKDILPIFTGKCMSGVCHGAGIVPEGLQLDTPAHVAATALGVVAHESNTGPRALPQPAGRVFGIDMPIVDPGPGPLSSGDPANSWLLYKILMAVPAQGMAAGATTCDGGTATPTPVNGVHAVPWQGISPSERGALSDLIPGREMPYPVDPSAPLDVARSQMTLDEMERISRWISQPRAGGVDLVPSQCGCIP
jgi:hypothetical protein